MAFDLKVRLGCRLKVRLRGRLGLDRIRNGLCSTAATAAATTPSAPALGAFHVFIALSCLVWFRGRLGCRLYRLGLDAGLGDLARFAAITTPVPVAIPAAAVTTAFAALALAALANFARSLVAAGDGRLFDFVALFLVFKLQEVSDIQERVPLQPEVDKGGLHAGKHAGHTPVVDGTREGVLVFAFVINFSELVVFQNR
jgi:hypothetical protein